MQLQIWSDADCGQRRALQPDNRQRPLHDADGMGKQPRRRLRPDPGRSVLHQLDLICFSEKPSGSPDGFLLYNRGNEPLEDTANAREPNWSGAVLVGSVDGSGCIGAGAGQTRAYSTDHHGYAPGFDLYRPGAAIANSDSEEGQTGVAGSSDR